MQVTGAQRKSMVHNVALYRLKWCTNPDRQTDSITSAINMGGNNEQELCLY